MAISGYYIASALVLSLLVTFVPTYGQHSDKLSTAQNPCVTKKTCRDCIQTKSCAWCLEPEVGDRPRCFQPSLTSITGGCPEQYTWNPDHEEHILIREELTRAGKSAAGGSVSGAHISSSGSSSSSSSSSSSAHFGSSSRGSASGSRSSSGKITQIYPQRVGLKLRISEYTFRVYINHTIAIRND